MFQSSASQLVFSARAISSAGHVPELAGGRAVAHVLLLRARRLGLDALQARLREEGFGRLLRQLQLRGQRQAVPLVVPRPAKEHDALRLRRRRLQVTRTQVNLRAWSTPQHQMRPGLLSSAFQFCRVSCCEQVRLYPSRTRIGYDSQHEVKPSAGSFLGCYVPQYVSAIS